MSISELYKAVNSAAPAAQGPSTQPTTGPKAFGANEFEKVLEQQNSLQLSKHAATRIRSRELPWSEELEKRISGGMDAAAKKGSQSALILSDDVAVIANIRSKTVVTAMNRTELKEKVFTNIDSAILV